MICRGLTDADAYATAGYAMGDRARGWLESLPGTRSLAITADGATWRTGGISRPPTGPGRPGSFRASSTPAASSGSSAELGCRIRMGHLLPNELRGVGRRRDTSEWQPGSRPGREEARSAGQPRFAPPTGWPVGLIRKAAMLQLKTSKLTTTLVLTVGAAALSLLGSSPAGAAPMSSSPAALSTQTAEMASWHVDGRVVSNLPLRIRSRATTASAELGSYAPRTIVHIRCKVNGQDVDGNPRWYKLSDRSGWVAARYVQNLGNVRWC